MVDGAHPEHRQFAQGFLEAIAGLGPAGPEVFGGGQPEPVRRVRGGRCVRGTSSGTAATGRCRWAARGVASNAFSSSTSVICSSAARWAVDGHRAIRPGRGHGRSELQPVEGNVLAQRSEGGGRNVVLGSAHPDRLRSRSRRRQEHRARPTPADGTGTGAPTTHATASRPRAGVAFSTTQLRSDGRLRMANKPDLQRDPRHEPEPGGGEGHHVEHDEAG